MHLILYIANVIMSLQFTINKDNKKFGTIFFFNYFISYFNFERTCDIKVITFEDDIIVFYQH